MFRKTFFCLFLLFFPFPNYAQVNDDYSASINKAMVFYKAKQYKESADAFTHAFALNAGKGFVDDRYNAACSWSLVGNKDSAFFQLNRIAEKGNFLEYSRMIADPDLISLHGDKRWEKLCKLVKLNKDKTELHYNKPLIAKLDTIFECDQKYRAQMETAMNKYGYNSKEVREIWQTVERNDSIDLIKVKNILDENGWIGPEIIGAKGSQTLFLVIQHSDLQVQKKYLPMMRKAVKSKNASPADLALLEDRVALGEGKKQIYGSQIKADASGHYWISPIEDPDNVDKRRAKMGLPPLADYVKQWNIKWDVAEYKKQLPEIEKKEKQ